VVAVFASVADVEGDAGVAGAFLVDDDGDAAGSAAPNGGAVVVGRADGGDNKKSGAPAWVDEDDAKLKVTKKHSLKTSRAS